MPRGTDLPPCLGSRFFVFGKGAFVNKLYITTCAILVPLVGCSGIVSENSSAFGGAGGVLDAGGSSSASHNAGSSGSAGTGSGASAGSAGVTATGGASLAGGNSNGGVCSLEVLPVGVQTMIANKCATCHGSTPLAGLPSLVSYA